MRSEVYERAVAKTEASRRSDRWAAMIVAGTSGAPFLDSLPDGMASALYGSVPGLGLLALLAGLAGRNRPRKAWMAWTGVIAGSLLLVFAAIVAVILLNAFLMLG
jgi:hypothetical protein